ncbi:MAG: hypothetical protein JWN97_1670 [Nocardioides sp.]|nr:hypothetical protein [Nocardioides sp.]
MLKVLLVVAAIALVVWVLVRLALRRLEGGSGGTSRPRVIGPDDDPDFLRGLGRPRKPEDD